MKVKHFLVVFVNPFTRSLSHPLISRVINWNSVIVFKYLREKNSVENKVRFKFVLRVFLTKNVSNRKHFSILVCHAFSHNFSGWKVCAWSLTDTVEEELLLLSSDVVPDFLFFILVLPVSLVLPLDLNHGIFIPRLIRLKATTALTMSCSQSNLWDILGSTEPYDSCQQGSLLNHLNLFLDIVLQLVILIKLSSSQVNLSKKSRRDLCVVDKF